MEGVLDGVNVGLVPAVRLVRPSCTVLCLRPFELWFILLNLKTALLWHCFLQHPKAESATFSTPSFWVSPEPRTLDSAIFFEWSHNPKSTSRSWVSKDWLQG